VVFAVYGLVAASNVIGIRSVLMAIVHMMVLNTVAYFTVSPLCVWIISLLFLLSFNVLFTQTLMVCDMAVYFSGRRVTGSYFCTKWLTPIVKPRKQLMCSNMFDGCMLLCFVP